MATVHVSHSDKLAEKIRVILGIDIPIDRMVIEMEVRQPVRVYVRGFVEESKEDAIAKAFELIGVHDIHVDENSEIEYTPAIREGA